MSAGRLVHLSEQALTFDESGITTESGRRLQKRSADPGSEPSAAGAAAAGGAFHDHPALIANPWRADSLTAIARTRGWR